MQKVCSTTNLNTTIEESSEPEARYNSSVDCFVARVGQSFEAKKKEGELSPVSFSL